MNKEKTKELLKMIDNGATPMTTKNYISLVIWSIFSINKLEMLYDHLESGKTSHASFNCVRSNK